MDPITRRTEDRTSTIAKGGILTTRIDLNFVDDISEANSVLTVPVKASLKLAALVWVVRREASIKNARLSCLQFAVKRLVECVTGAELWLVAGSAAVQPNSRIVRHIGFWDALKKRGLSVPMGEYLNEVVKESNGGLRFFSAVRFEQSQINCVHEIMLAEQAAIVMGPSDHCRTMLGELINEGWAHRNIKPPQEILDLTQHPSCFVLDAFGEFDDPEVAVAALGQKDGILELMRRVQTVQSG